jgi:hypothetical protein
MGAALLSLRAVAYLTGWTCGRTLSLAARLLPVAPPVPAPDPCPCICCAARQALAATGRTESPWCDCLEFPPHQRCDCGPCRQIHRPVEAVPDPPPAASTNGVPSPP